MRQTTLSVVLDVKPESLEHLGNLLDDFKRNCDKNSSSGSTPFAEILARITTIHFLSMSIFSGYDYDPTFVIEANFDGKPGPFWAQLEAAMGPELRSFLACCKRPLNEHGPLYDAIAKPETSRAPIAPYLEARAVRPSAYHHGNRGLTCNRILAEFELFKEVRLEIARNESVYRKLSPEDIHGRLRKVLLERFHWLAEAAPSRIGILESFEDYFKFLCFTSLAIFALSIPGLILCLFMPNERYLILLIVTFTAIALQLRRIADPLPNTETREDFSLKQFALGNIVTVAFIVAIIIASYYAFASLFGTLLSVLLIGSPPAQAWYDLLVWVTFGFASVPVTAIGILVWLRTLERSDCSQDAPPVDPRFLREMAKREDWIPQNHMGSVVLIKPGILRTVLIRSGHLGLGLLLRITARSGYLGSMRTIHFAHWAMINNNSRLMFLSNFDQTWESYLDDFIEKAHVGLTIAWSCGVGFPAARFLIYDGASRGRQFKEWARHSMAVSHFWYSAYKELTADQIERNYRIALGLRKTTLAGKEAVAWCRDL